LLGLVLTVACSAVEPLRALMVTGGCCHDYQAQKKILSEGISARAPVVWTIVHEGDADGREHKFSVYEKPDWAKGFDVVLHNECSGMVSNVDWVEHIARAHFEGVPAVVLHCSIHSYRASSTDEWRKLAVSRPRPDGSVVLDFNRAINYPSAFTPYGTCPMPVAGNSIDVAVEAGEKLPAGRIV